MAGGVVRVVRVVRGGQPLEPQGPGWVKKKALKRGGPPEASTPVFASALVMYDPSGTWP